MVPLLVSSTKVGVMARFSLAVSLPRCLSLPLSLLLSTDARNTCVFGADIHEGTFFWISNERGDGSFASRSPTVLSLSLVHLPPCLSLSLFPVNVVVLSL